MAISVLITGAAGYIGSMVVVALSQLETVGKIVGIDLRDGPALCAARDKCRFVQADIAEDSWVEAIRDEQIDVVVHCAYQIRQLYGRRKEIQRRWNMDGARKVFEFALRTPSVGRLIQLSTVSAYGAHATNSLDHSLSEEAALGEDEYLYGLQKRERLRRCSETFISDIAPRPMSLCFVWPRSAGRAAASGSIATAWFRPSPASFRS
jgi:nucleoside-diphosphate-sugar epimerase